MTILIMGILIRMSSLTIEYLNKKGFSDATSILCMPKRSVRFLRMKKIGVKVANKVTTAEMM